MMITRPAAARGVRPVLILRRPGRTMPRPPRISQTPMKCRKVPDIDGICLVISSIGMMNFMAPAKRKRSASSTCTTHSVTCSPLRGGAPVRLTAMSIPSFGSLPRFGVGSSRDCRRDVQAVGGAAAERSWVTVSALFGLPQEDGRMDAPDTKSLPENAYRPLAPGETYVPIVPAGVRQEEATVRSVGWGVFLCIVFTIASAYSGLKVGQVMEASIPISILAIGLARTFKRRSTLRENVIRTSIGGTSGGMVAGAIFTLPAFYILHLSVNPLQTSFILIAGGCLGVLFLIPLGATSCAR